jgi:uncharacterized protein (TIGR03437 family)
MRIFLGYFSPGLALALAAVAAMGLKAEVSTNDGASEGDLSSYSRTPPTIQSFAVNSPAPLAPYILLGGIVPLDSARNTIQPGEWISIYGSNLASGTSMWNGDFPTSLGGTSVKVNGKAAYLSLVSPGQINLQAPDDNSTGTVSVVVTTSNGSATSTVTMDQLAPSFALLDREHVAGIIVRPDDSGSYGGGSYDILGPTGGVLGYPTAAAKAGDTVSLFGVGFGPTVPTVPAGRMFSGAAATINSLQLTIGGYAVSPSFVGLSSAGLYQINVKIPEGLQTGDQALTATIGGVKTQTGVVISLSDAQTSNIAGSWLILAQSSVSGLNWSASGQLTQNGNNISGQFGLGSAPCATSAAASGTISGNWLFMRLNENGQLVALSGSGAISGSGAFLKGTYSATDGGCTNGDWGTWSALHAGSPIVVPHQNELSRP